MEGSQGGSLEQSAQTVTDNQAQQPGSENKAVQGATSDNQAPSPYKGTKHRVPGLDTEVDYDELVRGYGHKAAANKRFQEAAEEVKKAIAIKERAAKLESIFNRMLTSPDNFFEIGKYLGLNVDELAHKYVLERMREAEEQERDPEGYKLRRENAELRKWREQQEAGSKERQAQESQNRANAAVENELMDFLEKNSITLDDATKPMLEEALVVAIAEREAGRRTPIEKCYRFVEQKHQKAREAWYQGRLKEDVTAGKIPKELQKVFRQNDVKQLKRMAPPQLQQQAQDAPPAQARRHVTTDDWFSQKEKQFAKRG